MTKRHLFLGMIITIFTIAPISIFGQKNKFDPDKAAVTIEEFKEEDPGMTELFDEAYGYAVFPAIGKGGMGIGGATGRGIVYEQGEVIGGSRMIQVSVGFQFGGQSYAEVIFFEDEQTLRNFIEKNYTFSAQVSAVALKSGASANAKYRDGVMVFTRTNGGLMYEASIGGQKFKFKEL